MAPRDSLIEHLLRRIGFGAAPGDVERYAELGYATALDELINYENIYDGVDEQIGKPGYALFTVTGRPVPETNIAHARQRWLFRMVHTERPLQEKMTLFWHNHFATAYSKVSGEIGGGRRRARDGGQAVRASGGPRRPARADAPAWRLGNFRDLAIAMSKDPAMIVWLDGRTNVKAKPQENFARELMELFTMGVGHYTEEDVYAGARVFTGWNLTDRQAAATTPYYNFFYNAAPARHDGEGVHLPDLRQRRADDSGALGGGRHAGRHRSRSTRCVRHPATGPRLARKLYAYFVNEVDPPDETLIASMASDFRSSGFEIKPMLIRLFVSPQFTDPSNYFKRYSWPVEFVVRAIKEMGWSGFSVNDALNPHDRDGPAALRAAGRRRLGSRRAVVHERRDARADELRGAARDQPEVRAAQQGARPGRSRRRTSCRGRSSGCRRGELPSDVVQRPASTTRAPAGPGPVPTRSCATKASGLAHLIVGSGEYQLV